MATATIKQHVPIFISSTYEDLIEYREEVQRNLIRLEQIVKGMEFFGATPKSSLETCISQLRECKVCICILGMRYGSIDENSSLSFTQIEYNEAIKNNIPTLIYIMNKNHPIPPKFVDVGESAKKLEDFKEALKKRHAVSFFSSPEDLGKKVSQDLIETLKSMDEVEVDASKVQKDTEDFLQTFKDFCLRPAKFKNLEGELSFRAPANMEFSGPRLKEEILRAFSLAIGDTLAVDVNVLNNMNFEAVTVQTNVSVYADKENADWLQKVRPGDIFKARVKLDHCVVEEVRPHDNGRKLKPSSYTGLIITKGIEIKSAKQI